MILNKIARTCSMFELGEFSKYDISKSFSKRSFDYFIRDEFKRLGVNVNKENFSILYNCTSNFSYRKLKKLGFKQISYYKGESLNPVKILIWKSFNYSLCQKISLFFGL